MPFSAQTVNHRVSSMSQFVGLSAPASGAVLVPVVAVDTSGAVDAWNPLIKYVVCALISTEPFVTVIVAPVEA